MVAGPKADGTTKLTQDQVEALALADYEALVGKVVVVHRMSCSDARLGPRDVDFEPPAIGRVLPVANDRQLEEDVCRWMDEDNCDPVYQIGILEPHPASAGLCPYMARGSSRSTTPGYVDPHPDFRLASPEMQARYRDVLALDGTVLGACSPEGATARRAPPSASEAAAEAMTDEDVAEAVRSCTEFARNHRLRVRFEATVLHADGRAAAVSLSMGHGPFVALPMDLDPDEGIDKALASIQAVVVAQDMGALEGYAANRAEAVARAVREVLPEDVMSDFLNSVGCAPWISGPSSPSP